MTKSAIVINGVTTFVCDCEGTAPINAGVLGKTLDDQAIEPATMLCGRQLNMLEEFLPTAEGPVTVACTQMSHVFEEMAEEIGYEGELGFANIREKAGWSKEVAQATPKVAALLSEASLSPPDVREVVMESDGSVLILGSNQPAVMAAQRLSSQMDVTLVVERGTEITLPAQFNFTIFNGKPVDLSGHLGAFTVTLWRLGAFIPSSRGEAQFEENRSDGNAECALVLDLRGDDPLVNAPEKRDGYFNPDPGSIAAVEQALFELANLVGEFEKPRYVSYQAKICAHSRSGITGCTRCLDLCPTGAIAEIGESLEFDPYICAGCGSCAAACPTGAVTYNLPGYEHSLTRLKALSSVYHDAGGEKPVLFVHDLKYGEEMISAISRFGDGLPARVIPFAVNEVSQFGQVEALAALAYGFVHVFALVNPAHSEEHQGLQDSAALVNHVLDGLGYGDDNISIIDASDPDAVTQQLYTERNDPVLTRSSFTPSGDKRSLIRNALNHLHKHAHAPCDILPLPAGAPFGTIDINTEGCTMCLSCVNACPANALLENTEKPELRFRESACVQCGLCKATCPEKVISLDPRMNFTNEALNLVVLNEEEPFECVRCGKAFGVKSMIDNMTAKLEGHSMFADPTTLERIKMCDNCRVVAMTNEDTQPLFAGNRPKTRTTDDYLSGRITDEDPED
ncbi:MAG: 4Fe-4S binding protein [Rhodospirillales bacterium]|jgi:ferredoxin|nr:4Fe-4S binding protein [Rhodospirillales bacterium]MBT4040888.1 4Fe-4S binding protein [Rhodospirillales bacterium]MBT4626360.1 4Fe-4S binding protein [Rhodospirillales bacterium]MBT5352618.1 4Fe-4S binding protein [Rhodospirillales bacterium]MBT5519325.1 4Fe-4S binding protein [Rhodospirillales bacterium]